MARICDQQQKTQLIKNNGMSFFVKQSRAAGQNKPGFLSLCLRLPPSFCLYQLYCCCCVPCREMTHTETHIATPASLYALLIFTLPGWTLPLLSLAIQNNVWLVLEQQWGNTVWAIRPLLPRLQPRQKWEDRGCRLMLCFHTSQTFSESVFSQLLVFLCTNLLCV